jgi:rod shape-determining protein MreC
MLWIIQFFAKNRIVTSLVITVIASILMINTTATGQQNIARFLTMSVFLPFQVTVNQFTKVRNIFAENTRLKQQVVSLSTRMAQLQDQETENQRLRAMLQFKEDFSFDLVPARVLAHEPSEISRSLVINAGHNRGVVRYMPLVSTSGVVGRVVQVLPTISLVQIITDPLSRTSVMTQRSRIAAILETETGTSFYMQFRADGDIVPGDTIVTSGLGGVYPKGLYVGAVLRISGDPDPLFRKAWIKPFVNFNSIEEVFVIKLEPQWSAFRSELDSLRRVK